MIVKKRHEADKFQADRAFKRFNAKDVSLSERIAYLAVAGAMRTRV